MSNNLFACHRCYKLLPRCNFADKQMKRTRTKGHADSGRRFCLKCGIDRAIYHPGNSVRLNGLTRYLCESCMLFRGGLFCSRCYWCGDCLGVDHDTSDGNVKGGNDEQHQQRQDADCKSNDDLMCYNMGSSKILGGRDAQRSSRRPTVKCPRCSVAAPASGWLTYADPELGKLQRDRYSENSTRMSALECSFLSMKMKE
jgi:hypothetical protein